MSYCPECYGRNHHFNGCPEDDGDYDDDVKVEAEYEEETPDLDYDVVWDGKNLRCEPL